MLPEFLYINGVKSYTTFLDALERPLKFLQQTKYKNLELVKNLESHVTISCQKAASHIQNARLKTKMETLQGFFADFGVKSDEQKIQIIEQSLQLLTRERETLQNRFQFREHEHPALDFKQIQEKMKKLETNVQFVKGVGPVVAEKFRSGGILNVFDLLHFVPTRYEDRRNIRKIKDLQNGEVATIMGKVVFHGVAFYRGLRKKMYEIVIADDTGEIKLKWFHFFQNTFQRRVQNDKELIVSGKVVKYQDTFEIHHPDFEVFAGEKDTQSFGKIIPIYREIGGMYQKNIRKITQNALLQYGSDRICLLPHSICRKFHLLPPWKSLSELHLPSEWMDEQQQEHLQRMLAFEELFFYSFALQYRKRNQKDHGISFDKKSPRFEKLLANLPFELTSAQKRTLEEIRTDMQSKLPMNRLIQGDVGSGKTIISFLAAQIAIDHGYQVALIAPSEILCEQHFENIKKWAELLDFHPVCLLGKQSKKQKEEIVDDIRTSKAQFVVGTQALLEETVSFKSLGLVIIDEQHRFGVRQKEKIRQKAHRPDVMIMSATPIPRSLALTLFGDLDISIMNEMPRGRKPITTYLMKENQRANVYERIEKTVDAGQQAFIVYPLVESSEHVDAKDAVSMMEELQTKIFPKYKLGLIHGQMSGKEKEAMMQDFKKKKIQILVSTTVIEVGIDIPNATMMVIEHPERFGLAQLHQLRGRVGRADIQSTCILIAPGVSQMAFDRLKSFTNIFDGFHLAEEDLRIRGPGDFFGIAQSGLPNFSNAQLPRDLDIMEQTRLEALHIFETDPKLQQKEHQHFIWLIEHIWKDRLNLPNIA